MIRTLPIALVLLLSAPCLSAHAAEASAWSTTFPAQTLATHLGDTPARYMVVPAGGESPELTQAEQALTAALRASGKASLVMSAQALGPVAQLADGEIARRSASFPVDRVMVLRLFPDGSGALTQAVVTLYDTGGKPLGSFSAVAGTALATSTEAPPSEVAAAPQPVAPPAPPRRQAPANPEVPPADALEQYEQRHIGFDELVAVSTRTGMVMSQWAVPYEGKYKKPLEGDAFYRKVGREDLVTAYNDKMSTKTAIAVLGGAALVGGGIVSVVALTSPREDCSALSSDFGACINRNSQRMSEKITTATVGLGIAGAGVGLMTAAIYINPHPVNSSEARELADGYNKKLKVELGLSEEGAPAEAPARPVIQARLTPAVGPGGAGLVLSGTF
jgi:hypothetical protein